MKKKTFFKIALAFVFYIALNLSSQAQSPKYFIISGKIISETEFIEPGEIRIVKNDSQAIDMPIPSHGRFRLELDYNTNYKLTISQVGRIPKIILVDTNIPTEVSLSKINLPHFLMAIKLKTDNQDVSNIYYSEDHKQLISYSLQNECFLRVPTLFDIEHADKINQQQASTNLSPENKSKLKIYQVF